MNNRFNLITLVVIAGLAALLFAGVGITGAAAQAAIPGDALYPLKTTLEQTRLSMAGDAGQRAQMKMAFAEQRLDEIAALIEEGRYHEINDAVLAFESGINGAIRELNTLAQTDPARAARLAQDITNALTRYGQTLGALAASAPSDVRSEVNRALTSATTASRLEIPDGSLDDNSNSNANDNSSLDDNGSDDDSNDNGSDDNSNANVNDDDDDDNSNSSSNDNGSDDNSNANINDDNGGDDDNSNSSINDNGSDDNGSDDNGNDNGGDDNGNDNGGDDNGNDNGGDDNGNDNGGDDNGNDNGGSSGRGGN